MGKEDESDADVTGLVVQSGTNDRIDDGIILKFGSQNGTTSAKQDCSCERGDDAKAGVAANGVAVVPPKNEAQPMNSGNEKDAPRRSRSRNSLELRKTPTQILVMSAEACTDEDECTGCHLDDRAKSRSPPLMKEGRSWLQRTCLRPQWSLRTQMVLSFGSVSVIGVLLVMATAIATVVVASNNVRERSMENIDSWAGKNSGPTARYVAEALTPKILPTDVVEILRQAVRDRFVGYPNATGYEDDSNVPFFDASTGTNRFPLNSSSLLRLDWQMDDADFGDANQTNVRPGVSTAYAMYQMQGACDPNETDPSGRAYYPNCTAANNDVARGGLVAPSSTNDQIFRKSSDFAPLLKALYEYDNNEMQEVGVFFANSGSGSVVMFPHTVVDQKESYTSIGCEWMSEPNPLDPKRPIAPPEVIGRCRPNGTIVSAREYNPLERAWCRDQALAPHRVVSSGPFPDAWSDRMLTLVGRAVYDRLTNEFIACTVADFHIGEIERIIREDVNMGRHSTVSLVKWDDAGTVVASQRWDPGTMEESTISDDNSAALGVDKSTFDLIKSLVDFRETWNPENVHNIYETTFRQGDGRIVSGFPIPPPPDTFDSMYQPDYMVILSVEEAVLHQSLQDVDGAIDESVRRLIWFTLIVGFGGLLVVILVILVVSHRLTEPLQWMNRIATEIVDKFGQHVIDDIDLARRKEWFIPRTEVGDVVVEFQKMVSRFSGEGTAKSVTVQPIEVKNRFTLFDDFQDLYESRKEQDFKFDYSDSSLDDSPALAQRRHMGSNIRSSAGETTARSAADPIESVSSRHVYSSPLFWWIVSAIVIPLLLTTVTIAAVVTWQISTELPSFVGVVEAEFVDIEKPMLSMVATLRAMRASSIIERAARDLHVFTRVAGWLLFDGIERSGSFTQMTTGAESCKASKAAGTCSYQQSIPCDCTWIDQFGHTCHNYTVDSRYLQQLYFEGQSQDSWPNGDRNSTSFRKIASSPNTTAWWKGVEEVPGSEKGVLAAGHETTYDRLRVISALSAVQFPLYNYEATVNHNHSMHIGFEADGMMVGYMGCDGEHADFPFWKSSVANGGSEVEPELCPLGKYGYDARCSDWYASSKAVHDENLAPLRVEARFGFTDNTGQGATMPLVDPITEAYVGTTMISFRPASTFVKNTPLANGGFSFLTRGGVEAGEEPLLYPSMLPNDPRKPTENLFFPSDEDCIGDACINSRSFEDILHAMQAGKTGVAKFSRTTPHESTEIVHVAYAPVYVRSFRAVNSSVFYSGVEEFSSQIYSIAFAEPQWGILEPFQEVEETVQYHLAVAVGLLGAFIALASAFIVFISSRLTVSITKAIVQLLELIRGINRLTVADDHVAIDDYSASCREVSSVFDAMEILHKVVRFANSAFFAGNLEQAYDVMIDALALFERLRNKKAVAVANNNLGNTMLTMYRTMKKNKAPIIFGMTRETVVSKGLSYFHQAIALGEEAYDEFYEEEGWSTKCLTFMQHLSNRYFNRAMFLLTVKDDHERPDEAVVQGHRDLQIVQDLDIEVTDQCAEVGFKIDTTLHFDLMMVRIRGLLTLMEMGYPNDWAVEERIGETYEELKASLRNPASNLFCNVGPAGRMQQVDAELLRYAKLGMNDSTEAARIGIRMLVEDEYTFANEQLMAVNSLIDYLSNAGSCEVDNKVLHTCVSLKDSLRKILTLEIPKTYSEEVEEGRVGALQGAALRHSVDSTKNILIASVESSRGDVTMEMY